ncbi:hypothetical protein SAMN06265338_12623 [Rhodoblastus acidophilus]|uniref:Uncharacterized protein n=2 Tax=Rhodoblastus acidophilus TaxID=1074 RepID=A0A212SDK2_RHOAC|nr:hypothetical protein CKO16_20235 [Rhodoblastus acidophilus]RAI17001.1 hypothetical protein CH337_18495 [Rhodoblastus acidophilus]SNB83405.1 hypothetical protein SAMN06265338_12623 [Rhodoblastus acidophilus]
MTASKNRARQNEIARQISEVEQFGDDLSSALLKANCRSDEVQAALAPLEQLKDNLRNLRLDDNVVAPAVASNRPGDMAAIYAEETGVDYATALVHCNMD